MIATQDALLKLWPIFLIGILLFDGILLLFNSKLTISRALIRGPAIFQLLVCIGICLLILHFWSDFF